MITLAIQLVFQNRAKMTHQEVTNYLIEHFPEGEILVADGPTKEGEVRFKLDQKALTVDQRDFLHLDEIAEQYIDEYNVLLPDKPSTPTASDWQEMKRDLEDLRQRVSVLERNNPNVIHQRFLDFFNGMDLPQPQAPQQETIDQDKLRSFVYAIENAQNEAIEALMPLYHDDVLAKAYSALIAAQQDTLEMRAMLGGENNG